MTSRTVRRSVQFASSSASGSSGGGGGGGSASASFSMSSSSGGGDGSTSPLSPTRLSRMEEKQALSHLNDRLSQYIDRVRHLENENQRLSYQIRSSEETVIKEKDGMRAAYEAELADARRLLDETAKDRARVQIDAGKYKAQVDELNGRIGKLERDLKDADGRRLYAEQQLQEFQAKFNNAENMRKGAEDEARKLRAENADLKKQLAAARQQLEEETLLRVDLENRLQSLREELAFNKQLYEKELGETRQKRQTEITEINTALEDEYQQKLQEGLNDMREQFDMQLRLNRREVEDMYERKLESARSQSEKDADQALGARDEVKRLRIALDSSEKDRTNFENMFGELEKKVKSLESQLQSERDNFYARLSGREEEIRRLNEEINNMIREYQDLMDLKIRLDVEIEAYRKLLEAEETRLNISAERSASSTVTKAVQRGAKRKRVTESREDYSASFSSSSVPDKISGLEIADHDADGLYVRIVNNGNEDVALGNMLLKRRAGGDEVTYKFYRTASIKAGATVTVWSSDAQVTHSPPSDIVMRNQSWPTGDSIRSWLVSVDGDDEVEVASRESNKAMRIMSSGGGGMSGMSGIGGKSSSAAEYRSLSYRGSASRPGDYSSATSSMSRSYSASGTAGQVGDDQKCVVM